MDWEQIHHVSKQLTATGKGPLQRTLSWPSQQKRLYADTAGSEMEVAAVAPLPHREYCPGELSGFTGTLLSPTHVSHKMNLCSIWVGPHGTCLY